MINRMIKIMEIIKLKTVPIDSGGGHRKAVRRGLKWVGRGRRTEPPGVQVFTHTRRLRPAMKPTTRTQSRSAQAPRLAANKAGESPAQHGCAALQGPQRAALNGVGPRTPGPHRLRERTTSTPASTHTEQRKKPDHDPEGWAEPGHPKSGSPAAASA
jgi:hypothetical protein